MRWMLAVCSVLICMTGRAFAVPGAPAEVEPKVVRAKPAVALLLEDNGDELLPKLTNPTGCPGEGHVEKDVVFSGKSSVRIVPMQRFSPEIPEWKFCITEKPAAGEYRYLRFAWRAPGCSGIMLQLHDLTDWNIRLTAGVDKYGWGTQYVAPKPPAEWTLVTVDLFKDFGERTICGLALTCFDGEAGYFDHIYFGRSLDDLDRIDATGLTNGPPLSLTRAEIETRWQQALTDKNPEIAYQAIWTLAAAPQAVPFIAEQLRVKQATEGTAVIKQWIKDLDHETFATREKASENLVRSLPRARRLLESELRTSDSAEVKARIKLLLKAEIAEDPQTKLVEKGMRVLELSVAPAAQELLKEFAQGNPDDPITELARLAIQRSK